jgi:hypothetical protein
MSLMPVVLLHNVTASGLAEPVTRVVQRTVEGETENVTETLYHSPFEFSFWYDEETFLIERADAEYGSGVSVSPVTTDYPVYMEIYPPETVGVLPWKYLELNAEEGTEYSYEELDSGARVHWFSKQEGELVHSFFAVDTDETFVVASLVMTPEAEEGFGPGFLSLIRSLALGRDMEADTEEPARIDAADPVKPAAALEQKMILVDYFERELTADGPQPYFAAVLYSYSDTQALMEIYTAGGSDRERMTSFLVPLETMDQLMEVICAYGMDGWNSQAGSAVSGKLYVCKFRQGGSLIRVTSENMPDNGVEAFDAVWDVMEKARLRAAPLP